VPDGGPDTLADKLAYPGSDSAALRVAIMRLEISFTMLRLIGVWLLCGFGLLAACNEPEQPSPQSVRGATTRGDQGALAETAMLILLLRAKEARKESEPAFEPSPHQLKKEVDFPRLRANMAPAVSSAAPGAQ
jgi:hypothetical protein